MTLLPGQPFAVDYTLLRPLGGGGMGEVWLARERALGRDVALKIMRPAESVARALRFAREAQALAALDHPSILPVLRTGEDPATGLRFLATRPILLSPSDITRLCDEILRCPYPREHAEEKSHAESAESAEDSLVSRHPSLVTAAAPRPLPLVSLLDGGKTLPQAAVLRLARDLASALSAAHAAGILHRDIKPSNILFDASGRALLADFGLAKFVNRHSSPVTRHSGGEPPDSISLDESGTRKFLGSPAYAAPETFHADAAPSPALDWYSFGAVLYEALTGERPRSLRKPSSFDPARISRRWDSFLAALLEPDPTRRLADPAAVTRRLDAIARAIDPAAHRRHAARAALAAAAVLAAAAALRFHAEPISGGGSGEAEPPPVGTHAESAESSLVTRHPSLVTPAAPPLPPRLDSVWQGENRGPLQLLGVFRLAPVERLSDEALAGADPETRRLLREGDDAWGSWRGNPDSFLRAADAWSAAVARIEEEGGAEETPDRSVLRAFALVRLAWTHVANAEHGEADEPFRKALAAVNPLVESGASRYGPLRSWILSERAYMECMEGRFPESVTDLREAGLLWARYVPREEPGSEAQQFVLAASLGGMLQAVGDTTNAVTMTVRAAKALDSFLFPDDATDDAGPPDGSQTVARHSSFVAPAAQPPLLDLLAGCLYRLGEHYRETGVRSSSSAAYGRAADLWRDLFRTSGERYRGSCIQALGRLGPSLAEDGRLEEAVATWEEIRDLVAPVFASAPALYRPVLAATLDNLVRARRLLGDEPAALALEAEAAALAQP